MDSHETNLSLKPSVEAVSRSLLALEYHAKFLAPAAARRHFNTIVRAAHACGISLAGAPIHLDLSPRRFEAWRHGSEFPIPEKMASVATWLRDKLAIGYRAELLA